ncbi:MAG: hypothetical protein Q8O42_12490 [Acidobacteriota bacterium]|nr:hypothetical protein [Acidobacteriota bacterium]
MIRRFVFSISLPGTGVAISVAAVAMLLSGAPAQAQKRPQEPPPPVTATFRCTTTVDCGTDGVHDRLTDDGVGAYPSNATSASDEGSYINVNGGVTINLLAGVKEPDRSARLDFGDPTSSACVRRFTAIEPADFVMSAKNGTTLESMTVGVAEEGVGKIQFKNPTPDGYAFWTIRFPSGSLTVTRTHVNQWTFESNAAVELQCTTSKRPTVTATDGFYSLPFKLTVVKQ